jgi:hypothetical protein
MFFIYMEYMVSYSQQIRHSFLGSTTQKEFVYPRDQCCGSGSGIRDWVLFDPWIRDPE